MDDYSHNNEPEFVGLWDVEAAEKVVEANAARARRGRVGSRRGRPKSIEAGRSHLGDLEFALDAYSAYVEGLETLPRDRCSVRGTSTPRFGCECELCERCRIHLWAIDNLDDQARAQYRIAIRKRNRIGRSPYRFILDLDGKTYRVFRGLDPVREERLLGVWKATPRAWWRHDPDKMLHVGVLRGFGDLFDPPVRPSVAELAARFKMPQSRVRYRIRQFRRFQRAKAT